MTEPSEIYYYHRYYDCNLAEVLDEKLNRPYESQGMPCTNESCPNDDGFNYERTGYVVDDRKGIYVEKRCETCGEFTTDGDADFHIHYRITTEGIIDIEEEER